MLIKQAVLAIIGLSSGVVISGGLFGLIVGLGVISDLADRTHTGQKIFLYENAVMLGGIWGNLTYLYQFQVAYSAIWLGIFGLFAGIFTGCWAMALAEILNVFPIFIRRIKLVKCVPYIVFSVALGKTVGSFVYFLLGWQ